MARKSRYTESSNVVTADDRPILVGQYSRLSVADGDDILNNSIGNQQKVCDYYMAGRSEMKLIKRYFDNGYTGMNFERPGFQEMLTDLKNGQINCVVVKDISRLGRHYIFTSEYVERAFPEMGVRLVCINDGYDSSDENADAAKLMLPFRMVMNDSYAKDISKKIRSSINAKMGNGDYIPASGSIPYGYLRNSKEHTYEIDKEAAPVVEKIFHMRLEGMSFTGIAKKLNEMGYPSPGRLRFERGMTTSESNQNAVWSRGMIRKITNNEVYIGKRIHGMKKSDKMGLKKTKRNPSEWIIINNAHSSIISEELFDQVQEVNRKEIEKRKGMKQRAGVPEDYRGLLKGKIICADCGRPMAGLKGCARVNAHTPSRIFYECSEYKRSEHRSCCKHYIRQEAILKAVTDLLDKQFELTVEVEKFVKEVKQMPEVASRQADYHSRLAGVRMKVRNLEEKKEQLLVDLAKGLIDREEYEYAREQYGERLTGLKEQLSEMEQRASMLDQSIDSTMKWLEMIKWYKKLPLINRDLLDYLVKEIRVHVDKRIEVELNYKDPFAILGEYLKETEVEMDAV